MNEDFARDAADALSAHAYPLAARMATLAIEADPRDARALNYRAMAEISLGRYESAQRDAEAALALAPDSAAARQTRVRALIGLGRYREALSDAESSLQADPGNAFAYENKADALAGLGDAGGSASARRMAAGLNPRFAAQAQAAPSRWQNPSERRVLGLAFLIVSGGLLIALAILNFVSARRRSKVR